MGHREHAVKAHRRRVQGEAQWPLVAVVGVRHAGAMWHLLCGHGHPRLHELLPLVVEGEVVEDDVLDLYWWKICISTPWPNRISCVSRELVTGLFSLLASTMCRNWLFGISLMNVHLIWNVPFHLSCPQLPNLDVVEGDSICAIPENWPSFTEKKRKIGPREHDSR